MKIPIFPSSYKNKKSRDYKRLLFCRMNEYRKPEFKRGVKYKEGSCLKANGIFVILLSLDVFESDFPERKS